MNRSKFCRYKVEYLITFKEMAQSFYLNVVYFNDYIVYDDGKSTERLIDKIKVSLNEK
jgi:hypothetical protein